MTTQSFNLELIPQGIAPQVYVSQYDTGQTWLISLFENNMPFNIPSGAAVTIQGTKPDNTGFQYGCTFSGNVVTATEEQQMTIVAGKVSCEIVVSQSGAIIASLNFYLIVEPSALADDTAISETELPLVEQAVEAVAQIPALIVAVEGYADAAEQSADRAAEASANPPIIGNNGNWYIYNAASEEYVDTGLPSKGADGITPVIAATASVDANVGTPDVTVTKSGTAAAPSFAFGFSNIKGAKGDTGDTGATGNGIASIAKTGTAGLVDTYTITFTNGTTTTFTVTNGRDGQGAGDMTKAVYDSDDAVSNAGGIPAYVHDDLITDAQWNTIVALYT